MITKAKKKSLHSRTWDKKHHWFCKLFKRTNIKMASNTNGTQHSVLFQFLFISFARPASLYCEECVYTHTYLTAYRFHVNYPLLPNNIANETFLNKSGGVRSVDCLRVFIIGVPAWLWLGEYVTLDKTSYTIFFSTRKLLTTPVISKFSSLSHSSRKILL